MGTGLRRVGKKKKHTEVGGTGLGTVGRKQADRGDKN